MNIEYWRRPAVFSAIQEIAYLERVATHAIAGWLPKVVPLESKMTLGRFQFACMDNASGLLKMNESLSAPMGGFSASLPGGWRGYALAVDRSESEHTFLWSLFADLKARVLSLACEALRRTDPVLDQHIQEKLVSARDRAQSQMEWYRALGLPAAPEAHARALSSLWDARATGAPMGAKDWLWAPVDRVRKPTRPDHLRHAEPGSMSSYAILGTDAHTIETFHGSFDDEITTMELFGRCSYEHPDLPEEFHWAMARQASDESRHAQSCLDVMASFGGTYGQHVMSTGIYDFHYQFSDCEPGSKRELLWRLLLRSTLQEALSLDGFVLQIKKREFHGQSNVARVLESIMADEVQHVRSGLKWSTFLCGGDGAKVRAELTTAHDFYLAEVERKRRKYVMENPEKALAELEFVRNRDVVVPQAYPFDLTIPVNRVARKAAGMTNEDIEQIVEWGYAYP
jgi:uncharacterized ferritin-like protein (DUF455 family)